MNDGDWICSDPACGNVNFPRRTSCNRCKKERGEQKTIGAKKKLGTEIGKSAADKSRGLFSADDWQCSKCTNVNWARRVTCNVCNAPKFGEVEARTGYGGGYNERGIVEYRRREESSDDEFDEFGRRKKRKKLSESALPEKKPTLVNEGDKKAVQEEESEEEEEEGDLSKYDLWGSDAETNDNNAQSSNTADKPEKEKCDDNPLPPEDNNGKTENADIKDTGRRSTSSSRSKSRSRSSSSTSDSSTSSVSKDSSNTLPALKNKYDDFNLNSERENSPVQNVSSSGPLPSRKKDSTKSKIRSRSKDKRRSRSRSREKRRERDRDTKSDHRSRDRASNYPHRTGHRGARDRNTHPRHRPYHSYGGRQR